MVKVFKAMSDDELIDYALLYNNKLIEELSTIALAEFDAYTRFKAMAATGNVEEGLRLLDKLDTMTE